MTYIISAVTAKTVTGVSKDILDRKLEVFIPAAQLTVKKILGETGYDILIAAIIADPTLAAEADLKTLRDTYIQPYLAWRVVALSGTRMYAEPERNGTFTRSGDDYNSVSPGMLAMTKADSRDMAGIYKEELERFLADNAATYTWYVVSDECGSDKGVPNYTGGVITDNYRRPTYGY